MKAHIGVDEATGLVHSVATTAANVGDVTQVGTCCTAKRKPCLATPATRVPRSTRRPNAGGRVDRGQARQSQGDRGGGIARSDRKIEHLKASIRAAVEHPFRVVKRQFGHVKARYRGFVKNGAQVLMLFALSNLWMARRTCWRRQDRCARRAHARSNAAKRAVKSP